MNDLIWSFAPWLIFLLATRITSLSGAIALGLVASLIVSARAFGHHRFHLLDGASLVYFIGLGVALEAVHPGSTQYWSRYAQAGAHAFLTLIVLGSVAIGRPFTESYAASRHPRRSGTPPASTPSTGRSPLCGVWRSCWERPL